MNNQEENNDEYTTNNKEGFKKSFVEKHLFNDEKKISKCSNPNIKRVIIQMGMDKTATTSIQVFLSRNSSWLNKHSFAYKTDWGADNHSVPLRSLVSRKPGKVHWHIISGNSDKEIREYNTKNLSALCQGIRDCLQVHICVEWYFRIYILIYVSYQIPT